MELKSVGLSLDFDQPQLPSTPLMNLLIDELQLSNPVLILELVLLHFHYTVHAVIESIHT